MKTGKLDRRHNGYGDFKYYVRFFATKETQKFCDVRNWCWEQWGPSSELDSRCSLETPNPAWAWVKDNYNTKIYLASDKEFQWFILKWK